jgi:hypothetical protein
MKMLFQSLWHYCAPKNVFSFTLTQLFPVQTAQVKPVHAITLSVKQAIWQCGSHTRHEEDE